MRPFFCEVFAHLSGAAEYCEIACGEWVGLVGAGLSDRRTAAKGPAHSILMSTDLSPSLASQLLQGGQAGEISRRMWWIREV